MQKKDNSEPIRTLELVELEAVIGGHKATMRATKMRTRRGSGPGRRSN